MPGVSLLGCENCERFWLVVLKQFFRVFVCFRWCGLLMWIYNAPNLRPVQTLITGHQVGTTFSMLSFCLIDGTLEVGPESTVVLFCEQSTVLWNSVFCLGLFFSGFCMFSKQKKNHTKTNVKSENKIKSLKNFTKPLYFFGAKINPSRRYFEKWCSFNYRLGVWRSQWSFFFVYAQWSVLWISLASWWSLGERVVSSAWASRLFL